MDRILAGIQVERRLIGDALRAGRLVLAEGKRSVALGGSADGATIVTGDGNVMLRLDAAAAHELRVLLGPPVPLQLPSDLIDFTGPEREIAALEQALGDDGERRGSRPQPPKAGARQRQP